MPTGIHTGAAKHPLYKTWADTKQRCYNPNCHRFSDYGGRGITVCDRWKEDFLAFAEDLGPKPSPQHSIDRIDNDRGYESGNLRWATRSEQQRNKRTYGAVPFKGVCFDKQKGKYRAQIRLAGKLKHLGYFTTAEEAAAAAQRGIDATKSH